MAGSKSGYGFELKKKSYTDSKQQISDPRHCFVVLAKFGVIDFVYSRMITTYYTGYFSLISWEKYRTEIDRNYARGYWTIVDICTNMVDSILKTFRPHERVCMRSPLVICESTSTSLCKPAGRTFI